VQLVRYRSCVPIQTRRRHQFGLQTFHQPKSMNDTSMICLRLGGILVIISRILEQKTEVLEENMDAKFLVATTNFTPDVFHFRKALTIEGGIPHGIPPLPRINTRRIISLNRLNIEVDWSSVSPGNLRAICSVVQVLSKHCSNTAQILFRPPAKSVQALF
jgi:hypothetical protein